MQWIHQDHVPLLWLVVDTNWIKWDSHIGFLTNDLIFVSLSYLFNALKKSKVKLHLSLVGSHLIYLFSIQHEINFAYNKWLTIFEFLVFDKN